MTARPPTLLSSTRGGPSARASFRARGILPPGGRAGVAYGSGSTGVEVGVDVPEAPGALVSVSDIRQYIAAVDESATSLDDDRYATIVYDDPDALKKKADLASEWGDAGGMYAQVDVLRARAKGRSAAQVAREEAWGKAWDDVYARWQQLKRDAGYPSDMDAMSTGKWYRVRDLHREINLAHDGYEDGGGAAGSGVGLGYKATLRKKAEVVPSYVPGGATTTSYIPWIIAGGVVVGIVLLVGAVRPFLT